MFKNFFRTSKNKKSLPKDKGNRTIALKQDATVALSPDSKTVALQQDVTVALSSKKENSKTVVIQPEATVALTKKKKSSGTVAMPQKITAVLTKKKSGPELTAQKISRQKEWEVKKLPVWKPGDMILGIYKVEKVFSGGMGHVYIATHKKWMRKLAIKSPNEMILSNRELFARILREANSWIEMGMHPNIAYCYHVRNIEDIPHIIIEYVDGGDLKSWISNGKCNDYSVNLDIAIQFCHGMEFAHSKGMIHRDIKPENALMTNDGILKITDFGLVMMEEHIDNNEISLQNTSASQTMNSGLTSVGAMMGTQGYISPEQAEDSHNVDEHTDIFAFGVCLYEMFCKTKPYGITFGPAQEPPEPSALIQDNNFPVNLAEVLKKCVQWNPLERYGSFVEIRNDLNKIYQDLYHRKSLYADLELVGMEGDGLNNQGVSYIELKHYDIAHKCFKEAVAKEKFHPQANWNIGDLYELNQSLIHPEWKDTTSEMLNFILDSSKLTKKQIKQRTQLALKSESFLDAAALPLKGHKKDIESVVFSPDGQILASGSWDKTVKLWNVNNGYLIKTFKGHKLGVGDVAFSPDGKLLASGSRGTNVIIWNIKKSKPIKTLRTGGVTSVAFSSDGKLLATGGLNNPVKLWRVRSGKSLKTLEGHVLYIGSLAFSPNGKFLASGSYDKEAKLWNVKTGKLIRTYRGHSDYVAAVAFSPDGKFLASAGNDECIKIWDVYSGWHLKTLECDSSVRAVIFTQDGLFIVTGHEDAMIRLWDVKTGKLIKTLKGLSDPINSLAFSPDGKFLASATEDKILRLWINNFDSLLVPPQDFNSLKRRQAKKKEKLIYLQNLFDQNKFTMAYEWLIESWSQEGFGRASNLYPFFKKLRTRGISIKTSMVIAFDRFEAHKAGIESAAFSPNGRFLASASDGNTDKIIRLWDLENGSQIKTFSGLTDWGLSVSFSPNSKYLLLGSDGGSVCLWEVKSGKLIKNFEGHASIVNAAAFSPDGSLIVSVSDDNTLKLWETKTGRLIASVEAHEEDVNDVAFSPDGKFIASCSGGVYEHLDDKTIKLWVGVNARIIKTFEGHESIINTIAFSPDSKMLASGSNDNTVKFWDIETGKQIKKLRDHSSSVNTIAFSPDGQLLACGCEDSTIKLWDLKNNKILKNLEGHSASVKSVAFSPDGQFLASGSKDSTLRLWLIIPELKFDENHLISQKNQKISSPNKLYLSYESLINSWSKNSFKNQGNFLQKFKDLKAKGRVIGIKYFADYKSLKGYRCIDFSPDGQILASTDFNNSIVLYDLKNNKILNKLKGHKNPINSLSFSPDGSILASVGKDASLRLFDIKKIKTIASFKKDNINSITFLQNSRFIALGCEADILIMDIKKGKLIKILKGHENIINSIDFSSETGLIVSGSNDCTIRFWDLKKGKAVNLLKEKTYVNSVSFSPDGLFLSLGAEDKTIKFLDIKKYSLIKVLKNLEYNVSSLDFSPHGDYIVSASQRDSLQVWRIIPKLEF
ncbi:jouberin [Candidatus Magnetomoraceae bacterium gMMP-15]